MACKVCQSPDQREYPAEINVHFPGYRNLTKPAVWLFPKLLVCLDCGFIEFNVSATELQKLKSRDLAAAQPADEVP